MATHNSGPLTLCTLALLGLLLSSCGGRGTATQDTSGRITPIADTCDERPPELTFKNFQVASAVIGQPDFVSGEANIGAVPTVDSLTLPRGLGCGSLWVADTLNHRVVRFPTPVSGNGAVVERRLGHNSLSAPPEAGVTANHFAFPAGVHQKGDMLFVCDGGNNRLLIWNTVPSSNVGANVVLGHDDFTTEPPNLLVSASSVTLPRDCIVAAGKLLVSTGEDRVLIWEVIPTLNNTPASLVLGQLNLTSSGANLSASGMSAPHGMWSDGVRLAVADRDNDRVLIWNTFPTTNGQPADVVLGQLDFDTEGSGIGPARLNKPNGLDSNGSQFVVADSRNNRVLVWNTFPTMNGQPADVVLGQGDFNHETANDDDQDAREDATPGSRTLDLPLDVQIVGSKLYVCDSDNSRILVFDG